MKLNVLEDLLDDKPQHPKCAGYWIGGYDMGREFDCGYDTTIDCEDCKYGDAGGRKDPEAKCNQRE